MILDIKEIRKRYLLRVAGARDGKVYIGPETVHVHVTNRCNLRCSYCWYHSPGNPVHMDPIKDISLKKFEEIVSDCIAMKVDTLYFSAAGEPTLHPDFQKMMALLDRSPLATNLLTNGTFLPAQLASVVKADRININLGAIDRKGYRLLQGRDLFTRVIGNIARLVRYRDTYKPSLKIEIVCVVNNMNQPLVSEMSSAMKDMKVDAFFPKLMRVTDLSLDLKPVDGVGKDPLSDQVRFCPVCFSGWFSVSIELDESLSLCCHVPQMKVLSLNGMSLRKAWASRALMRMRLAGKHGHFKGKFDECSACRAHKRNMGFAKEFLAMRVYAKAKN
ncbi:MAG: radical SAM protein [Candidatus Omnitrophota bacterium]